MSAAGPCVSCGRARPPAAWRHSWRQGYCGTCYKRWSRHGFPPGGPPRPAARTDPRSPWGSRLGRIEDYADLRAWGVPDEQAAVRLGVSARTLDRYKQAMQETS